MRAKGVEPLLDLSEPSSPVLTAYRVPAGYDYASLHDFLKASGFVIYAGQGKFQDEIFRVAVMGEITDEDIDRLLSAFQRFWNQRAAPMRKR